jgi:ribosomal protein L11 methyltransferase
LDDVRVWPALTLHEAAPHEIASSVPDLPLDELVSMVLADFHPLAIEDLGPLPLAPGLWDPTVPQPPAPPPGPLYWRAFFPSAVARDAAARAVCEQVPSVVVVAQDVPDEDWATRSQQSLRAIQAGRFVVAPPWDVPDDAGGGLVIVIEPSRGFGTGHHASTRLCLRALSDLDVAGSSAVDLGTGSGVLALAVAGLGARSVLGVDIDPDAIDAARHSERLNPALPPIDWRVGDFRETGDPAMNLHPADVVLANLTGGMLIASAPRIRSLIAPSGLLVVSGFDESEQERVASALSLPVRASLVEDDWVGLVLQQT